MVWRISKPAGSKPPVVFIPGWGFDGRILGLARPPLPWHSPGGFVDPASFRQDLLGFLDHEGLDRIRLVGWSMGAHLALDFARDDPGRVAELLLLAMRHERPAAEIEMIRRELAGDPPGFLASFYRKCFLGDRHHYRLFRETLEEDYLRELPLAVLHRGLDYLAQARTLPASVKTRLIHGRRDIIVPLAEMAELPGAALEIVEHAGHLVFLSAACSPAEGDQRPAGPQSSWQEAAGGQRLPLGPCSPLAPGRPVERFRAGDGDHFSASGGRMAEGARKEGIRHHFSRAAVTYDRYAGVQHEVARRLAERLPAAPPASVLEIGCGTGGYTALLAERFPRAEILALDFSAAMLDAAASKLGDRPHLHLRSEDAEIFLDRAGISFDLITSNATCHWFADLAAAMANISRLLTPSGLFLASVFGPATLEELGQGLSFLFGRPAALPSGRFPAAAFLRRLLQEHFAASRLEEIRIVRQYRSFPELLHHIRKTGTAGWQEGPPPVFTRERLRRLDDWFAEHHGGYRVTYQVFWVRGEK